MGKNNSAPTPLQLNEWMRKKWEKQQIAQNINNNDDDTNIRTEDDHMKNKNLKMNEWVRKRRKNIQSNNNQNYKKEIISQWN